MNKVPSVSIVGVGKNRSGFTPLPDSESAAVNAAKKSRAEKNCILLKIGAAVVIVSAVLAGLAAFFLTRGSNNSLAELHINMDNLIMSDDIEHVQEVREVAASNEEFSTKLYNLMRGEEGNLIMSPVREVAASNEEFSTKLYNLMRGEEGNLIMSPFSVSSVMAMLSAGAAENTLQQITAGLSFPSSSSLLLGYQDSIPALRSNENFTLEAANSIFAMKDFSVLSQYQEALHKSFHASIQTVDFGDSHEAARMINNWVQKMTRDKIQHLIKADMLNELTRLVLVNAIYFKGDWAAKFNSQLTKDHDFTASPSLTVKVPMMRQEQKIQFAALEPLSSTMIELPYKGDRIVMQVLLPDERNGLEKLEEKLTKHKVQDLFDEASYETKVNIQLPKFKLEHRTSLTDYLTTLGMQDMFTGGVADFSGIDGTKQLYVSSVVQKAFIEVNEEGSEAAAATGAVVMMRSMPAPPEQFVADHPFLFYLRDTTTGMLLFQGRVVNPLQ